MSLPALDCPLCGAKGILFTTSRQQRNEFELVYYNGKSQEGDATCITVCPKCKRYLALRNRRPIQYIEIAPTIA